MKPKKLVLVILACLALGRPAPPCSSLAFVNNGFLVFGANYDNRFAPGQIFINRRNVRKFGWEQGTTGRTAEWVSRYGSVTISCAGYQLAWGGMNEAGLCFSTMLLTETRVPAADARAPLVGALWWQYMLDTCATIDEVRASAKRVRISGTEDHYFVCDRTGNCAVVECLGGRLIVRDGASLPVKALANAPYQACLVHQRTRAGAPAGGSYSSFDRFSRLADGLAKFKDRSESAAVSYAFGLLAGVAASGDQTRWSFVCDSGARVFYLKTFENPRVRFVDLKKIDFSCERPTAMLDAHTGLEGDITGAFHDYSHEEALAHMILALKYFRPEIQEETVRQVLAFFESFSCQPAGK